MARALSKLLGSFEESATLALSAKAKKLSAEGRSIINFGVGEPDFVTDSALMSAALEAAQKGETKYTSVYGKPSLRSAIAHRIQKDYGVSYQSDEVIVSSGGKQAIYHFLQSVIEPQDEVLILSPYWVSFPEMVKLVGGSPVIIRPRPGHEKVLAEDVQKAITPKTKVMILNSPSNPSGQIYSSTEVASFLKVLKPHPQIWLMSDDTYYTLNYSVEPWTSAVKLDPDFKERTCIIGSASKTYAMTGWRLGWALGPKNLIDGMCKVQSQVTSSACSLSQAAAEAALTTHHDRISTDLRQKFAARRQVILGALQKIKGLTWIPPEGAFYVFANVSSFMPKGRSVTAFAGDLLEKFGVCAIPGEAFGDERFIRLSYALDESQILEGIARIETALKS